MPILRKLRALAPLAALAMLGNVPPAAAQDYPSRPITIVVPFSAGGGVDVMARLLVERLRDTLKQSIVVENKPGASGMLGAQYVSKAAADGYTLLLGSAGETAINPYVYKGRMLYAPEKDLAPVSLVTRVPNVLVVGPSLKANNVGELVALAKAHPGRLTYATSGVGNPQHLNGALLQSIAGIDMVHVPYKGAAGQLADVAGGSVDMTFVSYAAAKPFIDAGRVKALAVTSAQRASFARNIPTIAETAGLAAYGLENWFGLFAPASTPANVVDRINQAVGAALQDPELAERLRDQGGEPAPMSVAQFKQFIAHESQQYRAIVTQANILAEN
ncbi:Bug family tripartite tricarboxylate transporter substrate binding protein [Achromobacter sp. AGC25]